MGNHRAQLSQHFKTQGGKCIWCAKNISLSAGNGHPDRATYDHFYNRRSALRHSKGNASYAACSRCNSARGKLDNIFIKKGIDVSDVWEKPNAKRLRGFSAQPSASV